MGSPGFEATPTGEGKATRLVARGSAATMAGFVVRFGARLVFLLAAGRFYGPKLFGAFSIAVALVELAVAVAGLSSKRLIFKWLDERDSARPAVHLVLDCALLILGAGIAVAALVVAGAMWLPSLGVEGTALETLVLIAPMIAGQALLDLILASTRWHHAVRYEVVGRSIVEPYAAAAVTLLAWCLGWLGTGLALGYIAGTLAALAYGIIGLRRSFGPLHLASYRPAPRHMLHLFREATVPTLSEALSALYTRADLYVVGIFMGEVPAGLYGMARQFRIPLRQVRQSFDALLTPIISRTLSLKGAHEAGRAVASATRLILAIQLAILVVMVGLGRPLLALIGPPFAAAFVPMLVLCLSESIQGAFGVGDLLLLYRKPFETVRITLLSIAINLGGTALLIAPLGLLGAALAVLAANLAAALLRRFRLKAILGISIPLAFHAGVVAATVAGAGAGWLVLANLSPLPWVTGAAAAVAGLAVFSLLLWGWGRVTGETLSLTNLHSHADDGAVALESAA
ncbi:MAG: lipopolysaccharide biosynthesis protein [Croceibacterium sp.]